MAEKTPHKVEKRVIAQALSELGFITLGFEIGHCDVLFSYHDYDCAAENEHSVRNLMRNAERNFANGLHFHLIVAPNFHVLRDIAQKLHKDLPPEQSARVGLLTLQTLKLLVGKEFPIE